MCLKRSNTTINSIKESRKIKLQIPQEPLEYLLKISNFVGYTENIDDNVEFLILLSHREGPV